LKTNFSEKFSVLAIRIHKNWKCAMCLKVGDRKTRFSNMIL